MLKMRLLFVSFGLIGFVGCTATSESWSRAKPKVALNQSDVELVAQFLNALYRTGHTPYRVIADVASEDWMPNLPLAKRNEELRKRLNWLRRAPQSVIKVNLHSGDRPKPWGSGIFVYSYNTATGEFESTGVYKTGKATSDLWIDVRHWSEGTRLLCLSHSWIDDFKDDIFHLREGERTFRFAIAIEPLID